MYAALFSMATLCTDRCCAASMPRYKGIGMRRAKKAKVKAAEEVETDDVVEPEPPEPFEFESPEPPNPICTGRLQTRAEEHRMELKLEAVVHPFRKVRSNLRTAPSAHARHPQPRQHRVRSCVRCPLCRSQASIFTWREGCARCRWGLLEMVDILDTFVSSCARAPLDFFSVEVAARSEGLASVNGARRCAYV